MSTGAETLEGNQKNEHASSDIHTKTENPTKLAREPTHSRQILRNEHAS